jgi:hypothetical protein
LHGSTWYQSSRREAGRVVGEAESGRFIDLFKDFVPFPDCMLVSQGSKLKEIYRQKVDFKC